MSNCNDNPIATEDMTRIVADNIQCDGIELSEPVVDLVIKAYLSQKRRVLLEGKSVLEDGIGTLIPSFRKVSSAFNPKYPFTAKLVTSMDYGLKDEMLIKLSNDSNFRSAVGADNL